MFRSQSVTSQKMQNSTTGSCYLP